MREAASYLELADDYERWLDDQKERQNWHDEQNLEIDEEPDDE